MLTFGLIAEGPTDQVVIENILIGFFADDDVELDVRFIQPPRPWNEKTAGWGHVFKCLTLKRHEEALQFNDYVVIHIDTDVQEEGGFGVPRREEGRELSVSDRVDRVVERLKQNIDGSFYRDNADRFLFAIAVDTIECWLLPLLYRNNKAGKTTGCLETANQALRKQDRKALSAGDPKFASAYEEASAEYRKNKLLKRLHGKNPSLQRFVAQLESLRMRLGLHEGAVDQTKQD
jgi:hypothetical protein